MKRRLSLAAFLWVALGSMPSNAGPTVGDIAVRNRVDKRCIASVYSYLDGSTALTGRERFDHFKQAPASGSGELGQQFMSFVAIDGTRRAEAASAAPARCRDSAGLP